MTKELILTFHRWESPTYIISQKHPESIFRRIQINLICFIVDFVYNQHYTIKDEIFFKFFFVNMKNCITFAVY